MITHKLYNLYFKLFFIIQSYILSFIYFNKKYQDLEFEQNLNYKFK